MRGYSNWNCVGLKRRLPVTFDQSRTARCVVFSRVQRAQSKPIRHLLASCSGFTSVFRPLVFKTEMETPNEHWVLDLSPKTRARHARVRSWGMDWFATGRVLPMTLCRNCCSICSDSWSYGCQGILHVMCILFVSVMTSLSVGLRTSK